MSAASRAPGAATNADVGFRFQVIGRFAGWRDGQPLAGRDIASRKGRRLLQVLLLSPDEPVRLGQLSQVLWGEAPPARVERSIASLISRLRALLGTDAIEGSSGVYRVRLGPSLSTDLADAQALVEEATARLAAGQPALASTAAERGLELVGTDTLLADEDGDWLAPPRIALLVLRRDLRRAAWRASFELGDPGRARQVARVALEDDPLDEQAGRAAMRAGQLLGERASALRLYEQLRAALAEDLGVDPAPETQQVHLALLRDEPPPSLRPADLDGGASASRRPTVAAADAPPPSSGDDPRFVGRQEELERLQRHWETTVEQRQPALVLLAGEAGIGKTRLARQLATTVQATGGQCYRARCHDTERSHFLAAIVELVTELGHRHDPRELREIAAPWAGALTELVPDLAPLLRPGRYEPSTPDVERRRVFQAVTHLLSQQGRERPVLVLLDDLHNADASTVEFLHYLRRHASGSALLVLATVRVEEGADALRDLQEVAERIDLGPLPDAAVVELARSAGADRFAERIASMTRGHTLSVVETLAALAEVTDDVDEPPVPRSLEGAVRQRIDRAGSDVDELLRAAAILGVSFELPSVAALLDRPVDTVLGPAERAVAARLLVVDGRRFAFANDLVREIVYRAIPPPVRSVRHERAARLLEGDPDAVGWHASAAEDWPRALASWLEAAERAASRYANRDADRLLSRALEAGHRADDPIGTARAHLARAVAREVLAEYHGALQDLEAAAELARAHARPDLEAAALRQLGGDVIVGLGRPSTDCLPYLEVGLDVAERAQLGRIEVELMSRIAVVWSNRARFDLAARSAERGLVRARELDDQRAVALALDAVKNVCAYTGALDRLSEVVPELEALLQDSGDLALLQWCVFESAMEPFARARWDAAALVLERALALNRRTGHPWGSPFLAQRSWLHRVRGDHGRAIADARTSKHSEVAADHPWWVAFADAMLGWALSEVGADDEAVACLDEGAAVAERDGMETYLMRCVSQLALAAWRGGDAASAARHLERAESLLAGVRTPPDTAFLHGAHAYAAAARVRLARGEVDDALRLLDVVRGPAEHHGWREVVVTDRLLRGRGAVVAGQHDQGYALLTEAVALAEADGMVPLAWDAHAALAWLAERAFEPAAAASHDAAARRHLDTMAASLQEPGLQDRLRSSAAMRRAAPSGEPQR